MAYATQPKPINLESAASVERAELQKQVGDIADANSCTPRLLSSASTWISMPKADVGKILVGVTICMRFLQYCTLDGVVLSFDDTTARFAVEYSDGDRKAMSLAQMAKWLPQEYAVLANEYLGESGKTRELPGAGRISAIAGGKIARKKAKGKTNKWKDAKEVGDAAAASQSNRF